MIITEGGPANYSQTLPSYMYSQAFSSYDFGMAGARGVLLMVILSVYELKTIVEINRKSAQAEIKDKLAHFDGLTGLYNRLSFTEKEAEIRSAASGEYVVIQFDINFLKKVNDNYGHAEGDRYIISAARIISESFSKYGKCYRIGGDEFFAILEGDDAQKNYDAAINDFDALVKDFNETHDLPVPLQIAHGKSEYVPGAGSLEEAEKTADKLMYDRKKLLKAEI